MPCGTSRQIVLPLQQAKAAIEKRYPVATCFVMANQMTGLLVCLDSFADQGVCLQQQCPMAHLTDFVAACLNQQACSRCECLACAHVVCFVGQVLGSVRSFCRAQLTLTVAVSRGAADRDW